MVKTFRRLKYGMLCLLTAVMVTAQVPTELEKAYFTGDLFGRSSMDFRKSNRQNIEGVVPKGSKGTVLETRRLNSGAYAIRLRVDSVPNHSKTEKNVITPPEETWVYFSQEDPWLAFKDKLGEEVQDPELALQAQAKRRGTSLRHPTSQETTKPQPPPTKSATQGDARKVEAGVCDNCTIPSTSNQTQKQNAQAIGEVAAAAIPGPTSSHELPASTRTPEEIKLYSESKSVEQMIAHAMRNKAPRSKKLCYRYVKRSLLAGRLVSSYPPGARAKDAMSDLKAQGMVNLLEDPQWKQKISGPKDAPKGAVLVYSHSRKNKAGHIEIKTGHGSDGGYVSDFYDSKPILGNENAGLASRRYQLIGVFVK